MRWREPTEEEIQFKKQILEEYPFLISREQWGKKISSAALGSKNIKRLLKHLYPGTKFEVKSDIYSGGSSIRVYWEWQQYGNAPNERLVRQDISIFGSSRFDGMTDSTSYDEDTYRNVFRDLYGDTSYVFTSSREIEPEELAQREQDFLQKNTIEQPAKRRGIRL